MRRRERSSDKIEQTLVKAILSSHYPVGSTLPPERELAKTFEVGRPTVREAIQRLEKMDGLLVGKVIRQSSTITGVKAI